MKLVFIYGPPATGKLTIATNVANSTKFKLFHNHLTQDLVREIYEDFGPVRNGLAKKIRLEVFKYTAEQNTDLIFTYVYDGDDNDRAFIDEVFQIVEQAGGEIKLVHLVVPIKTLVDRVVDESRKKYHKIHDSDTLIKSLEGRDVLARYPYEPQLELDTSLINAEESAVKIIDYIQRSS